MATSDPTPAPMEPLHKDPTAVKAPARKAALPPASVPLGEASMQSLLPQDGEVNPEDQQGPIPHHAAGFFNQPWVQNVLPLASSLALHVGIIVIAIFLFTQLPPLVNPNKEQVVIPESKSMERNVMPGGIEHPGLNNDKTRDAAQDMIKNSPDTGFSTSKSNDLTAVGGPGSESTEFEGANKSGGNAGNAFGNGGGGGTAPWGVPGGGGGLLPKAAFFGLGGNANKVIYLCDASGSMLSVFGALKQQLKESITSLDVTQQFNVIFFYDDQCQPLFKDAMHIASNDNKKTAMDFVDNAVSTGGTQPMPAIKFALAEKPELLYVLTDGFDQIASFDDVINAFKDGEKASDGKLHINCIFLQSDEDPKLEQVLKQIKDIGHGEFKKILKSDM